MAAVQSPGPGPWWPSNAARPLLWWDEHGLQLFAGALQDILSQWCAAWGMACDEAVVRCRPAGQLHDAAGRWLAFHSGGAAHAWLWKPEDADARLLQALFPAAAVPGPLARAVAGRCRQDALARLAELLGLARGDECDTPPPQALRRFGSGAAEADVPAPLGTRLLLGTDVAARWRGRFGHPAPRPHREPLVKATAALGNCPLDVQVELQGCEIDVGALQELQVGDVVRLEHGLHTPAMIRHAGAPFCSAYLGRRGNRKAVELAGRMHPAAGDAPQ